MTDASQPTEGAWPLTRVATVLALACLVAASCTGGRATTHRPTTGTPATTGTPRTTGAAAPKTAAPSPAASSPAAPSPAATPTIGAPSADAPAATAATATTATTATIIGVGAGLADLRLIGTWYHHGFQVVIRADGTGSADWRVYRTCPSAPPCDQFVGNSIIDGGHAMFTIRAVAQSSNAIATMVSSTDPGTLGASGTVQVSPVLGRSGPGDEIVFPVLRDPALVLCDTAALPTGDCGA